MRLVCLGTRVVTGFQTFKRELGESPESLGAAFVVKSQHVRFA